MQIRRWLLTRWQRAARTARLGPALLALLLAPCACALEFHYVNPVTDGPLAGVARGLRISGEVMPGDSARLIESMRRQPADAWYGLGRVELAISGGDQHEALMLADTLAPLYPITVTTADCAGACVIVWLSGAWRLLPQGRIGLQQQLAPVASGNQPSPGDAPPAYDPLPAKLRSYLAKQGLPSQLYERWVAGSGGAVDWLSEQDINTIGTWPPYYYEKLAARCPRLAPTEESFHALRRCAARLVISQKAFAFDKLLAGVNNPWWNESKDLLMSAPR